MKAIAVNLKLNQNEKKWKMEFDIFFSWSQTEDKHGPVDVLINCAGVGLAKIFENISIEEFKVQYKFVDTVSV